MSFATALVVLPSLIVFRSFYDHQMYGQVQAGLLQVGNRELICRCIKTDVSAAFNSDVNAQPPSLASPACVAESKSRSYESQPWTAHCQFSQCLTPTNILVAGARKHVGNA